MSLKTKLSLIIVMVVTVILTLNNIANYFTNRETLTRELHNQMRLTSKQISMDFQQWQSSTQYIHHILGEHLRSAAIGASQEMGPDAAKVTQTMLTRISDKFNISHMAIYIPDQRGFKAVQSTNPSELNSMIMPQSLTHRAVTKLMQDREATLQHGQLKDFWSEPIRYANEDPRKISKSGYYYDGTTNYIIHIYFDETDLKRFGLTLNPEQMLQKAMKNFPALLEVSAFNTKFFMQNPANKEKMPLVSSHYAGPVYFGTYNYSHYIKDAQAIEQTLKTRKEIMYEETIQDKRVIKSFYAQTYFPCVIGLVLDLSVVESTLMKYTLTNAVISLLLIFGLFLGIYTLSGYAVRPIRTILGHLTDIAGGQFDIRVPIQRRDELGLLALRVNTMSKSLVQYSEAMENTLEELKTTQDFLDSFINHTSDAIDVVDMKHQVIRINRAFEQLYGWSKEDAVGRRLEVIPEDLTGEAWTLHRRVMRGENISGFETVRQRKDGTLFHVSLTVSPIRDKKGKIIALVGISRDITERLKTEELLRQSDKLTVVGQLAAGVAHEIRNPLTTLRGFVQLQRYQKATEEHVTLMLSELDRINLIVSEFLVLAKPQAVNYQYKSINSILRSVLSLLEPQALLHNIEFHVISEEELPLVKCEENQLKQVFINVLKNAIDAMPEGGNITIYLEPEGKHALRLRFVDEGIGIPEEDLQQVGSPFYTGKENGTGLGIMVSQRLIENHHGHMHITSDVGVGTTVEIMLPFSF
ncbi:hypothetical protein SY83_06220 [Paenibacillus swuensis]|uniref:histidine kinase n=1 Tax=Paenibacillus swuensis TaxID=1178515 RepID=A0A172TG14_9BACL|nr:HAMP domain-containing sensor histidine kinase [Paenibacillus swuensis]ANE45950.1 hypothetical protein SY83_06220 [Paenibacillus swuensis]